MMRTGFDLHTHSVASGHGTTDTIADLAKAAHERGLTMLGISDHGPKTLGSATESYFRSLASAPKQRCGIEVRYGAECNILDEEGTLDLSDEVLSGLDYAIISFHCPPYRSGSAAENTKAMIRAMRHPGVRILGHPEDGAFPMDYEELIRAARDANVFPEINNASFCKEPYRKNTRENGVLLLSACVKYQCPVILSSDSHGRKRVGDFSDSIAFLKDQKFPYSLICQDSHLVLS